VTLVKGMTVPYMHGMDIFLVIFFYGTEQELFKDDVLKLTLVKRIWTGRVIMLRAAHFILS
jgi:hypothetical protein